MAPACFHDSGFFVLRLKTRLIYNYIQNIIKEKSRKRFLTRNQRGEERS